MDRLGSSAPSSLGDGCLPSGEASVPRLSSQDITTSNTPSCPAHPLKILLRSDEWDIADLVKTYSHLLSPNEKHLPYKLLAHSPSEDQTQYAFATALEIGISMPEDAPREAWKAAEREQKIKKADVAACMSWMYERLDALSVELELFEEYDWDQEGKNEILNREQAEAARRVHARLSPSPEPIVEEETVQPAPVHMEIELFPDEDEELPSLMEMVVDKPGVTATLDVTVEGSRDTAESIPAIEPSPVFGAQREDDMPLDLDLDMQSGTDKQAQAEEPAHAHAAILVLGSSWKLPELQKAYRQILRKDEADFPVHLMQSVPEKERTSGHFVLTLDLLMSKYKIHGTDEDAWEGVLKRKGYDKWGLCYDDLERCIEWLLERTEELDADIVTLEQVKEMSDAEKHKILNKSQLTADILDLPIPVTPSPFQSLSAPIHQMSAAHNANFTCSVLEEVLDDDSDTIIRRGIKRPVAVSDSDSDEGSVYVQEEDSEEEKQHKQQPQRVEKGARPLKKPRLEPMADGSKHPTSFGQSQRWTAKQKYMLNAKWDIITDKINALLPSGVKPRPRSRIRSHFYETLFPRFTKANNDGKKLDGKLDISWPDLVATGQGAKGSWTKQEQEVVWKEVFGYAQKNVKWNDVAEKVNMVADDASLYRKGSDCMKTWNDTVARHFFMTGRIRKK